ncbi:MAG: cobalamin-dependent protein [Pseudomonadota bacterium]
MTGPKANGPKGKASNNDGMLGASSAAFRKVITRSLGRAPSDDTQGAEFDKFSGGALAEALAQDPVNEALESEIIPRLLMAHTGGEAGSTVNGDGSSALDKLSIQISDFAKLPLQMEPVDLLDHIDGFLKQGIGFETICIDVLAPAARALGDMWCDDECDFIDVTMGLWRLQEVMRALSARVPNATPRSVIPATALFSPLPGDPHAFGAQMLDEIFAKSGWISEVIVKPQRRELLDRLSKKPFDMVGLTITRDSPVSAITSLVKTMRDVSANPRISIMIGGNMVNANPGLVDEVGADGTAIDARDALKLANRLVEASDQKAITLR